MPNVLDRFWEKVTRGGTDDCWEWTAARNVHGYGQFTVKAHQLAYALLGGEVPAGLVLDHTCRNPACCNPSHLEPVTMRENTLRGRRGRLVTHCPQGHAYDEENTAYYYGRRYCLACRRDRSKQVSARRKAERAALRAARSPRTY